MPIFEKDESFGLISLYGIAQAYLGNTSEKISLPGFQRNAVWNETRVEELWDSLLCYFPIGSILLARYQDFAASGRRNVQLTRSQAYPDTLIGESGDGYIVVDGQQRLNAISLGYLPFQPSSAARLWIDLADPKDPVRRQYDFYLCTQDNPFGRDLSKDEKRRALEMIQKEGVDDSEFSLDMTFPFKARIPLPFVEFCQWILAGKDLDEIQHNLSSESVNLSGKALEHIRKRITSEKISNKFMNELITAVREVVRGGDYFVPLILIEKRSYWMTAEKLGKLFERVNINGEVPPQAELFFSALKLRMPEINNYVAEVYNDPVIGRLLKPTDIVLSALRMTDPKIDSLKLDQFDNIAKAQHSHLLALMERKNKGESIFGQCMRLAYQVLHHNGLAGDIGLPRQYLVSLRPRVWQIILIWIEKNLDSIKLDGIKPIDRLNMIRYAVLDSLNFHIQWQRSLSNYVNNPWFSKNIAEYVCKESAFPGYDLFEHIQRKVIQDRYAINFRNPNTFSEWLSSGDEPGNLNWKVMSNEHFLVMFAQRHYLVKWEKYKLDIDHILPSAWMSFRAGPIPESRFWKIKKIPSWWRHEILNRSGNKRYWPDSLNRIYKDASPETKYINLDLDYPVNDEYNLHNLCGLFTVRDVLKASAIDEDLAEKWAALSTKNSREWTTQRFLDFNDVVNQRRDRLYKHLYKMLQFTKWENHLSTDILEK
ncbi:MAG: GmrSD restriction endonuclease domain-containing protein [Bellilinea sp.]